MSALNGLRLVKLNVEATEMVVAALRACDRVFKKIHELVQLYPNGGLPLILYDMYGTVPLTVCALRQWAQGPATSEEEMQFRIDTCIGIMHNELRANHIFAKLKPQPAP